VWKFVSVLLVGLELGFDPKCQTKTHLLKQPDPDGPETTEKYIYHFSTQIKIFQFLAYILDFT